MPAFLSHIWAQSSRSRETGLKQFWIGNASENFFFEKFEKCWWLKEEEDVEVE